MITKRTKRIIQQLRRQSVLLSGAYPYQLKSFLRKPKAMTEKERAKRYIIMGIYYGYPDCCIYEFIKRRPNSLKVSEHGFVLCRYHGREAVNKNIKPEDLIFQRICKYEFPKEDELIFGSRINSISLSDDQKRRYRRLKQMLSLNKK